MERCVLCSHFFFLFSILVCDCRSTSNCGPGCRLRWVVCSKSSKLVIGEMQRKSLKEKKGAWFVTYGTINSLCKMTFYFCTFFYAQIKWMPFFACKFLAIFQSSIRHSNLSPRIQFTFNVIHNSLALKYHITNKCSYIFAWTETQVQYHSMYFCFVWARFFHFLCFNSSFSLSLSFSVFLLSFSFFEKKYLVIRFQ